MNKIYCPNCGRQNDKHNTLCCGCGMKIYQIPTHKDFHCPACGTTNKQGAPVCYHCDFDFNRLPSLVPGQGKQNIAQEAINVEEKSIFMQKGLYVILGFVLVAFWLISLFLPWYSNPMFNINNANLIGYGNFTNTVNPKNFWVILQMIWVYLPFVAVILAIISLIRKRVHSIVTYCSFAIPWLVGFVILAIYNKFTPINCSYILKPGEICFIITIILFFGFDRLLFALKITKS